MSKSIKALVVVGALTMGALLQGSAAMAGEFTVVNRNDNLASFSNVDRAELTSGERKLTFVREGNWQITAPFKADADSKALDEMIRGLQRLRADEIVAGAGPARAPRPVEAGDIADSD